MSFCVCELATWYSVREGAKVSVTKYRFLQQLLALELRGHTPGTLHRFLDNPSEPLSASTVWGIYAACIEIIFACASREVRSIATTHS